MLCNLLKQIYLNDIHSVLSNAELSYSAEVKQTFLELWMQPNNTKTHPKYSDSVFYMKNNEYWFEMYTNIDDLGNKNQYFYCNYNRVWSIFESKYGIRYGDIKRVIKDVVENTLKLGSVTPVFHLRYGQKTVENTLKLGLVTPENEGSTFSVQIENTLKLDHCSKII